MNKLLIAAALSAAMPLTAIAGADFVEGDKTFAGEAELGATLTTGNTDTSSLKGRLGLKHELGNWENQYTLEALYKEDTDEVTAERYFAGAQGNYKFDDDDYLFVNANYEQDPFTGYDYKFTAAMGYGHHLIDTDKTTLSLEAGPGFQYKRLDDVQAALLGDTSESNVVAHGVMNFETEISESSKFKQLIVADYGDKLEARSESSLTANIIGSLAMKFAVVVRYNSDPLDGKKSTDTETNMTLLYAF
ncbi:YdiY family protein [Shewanella sp.]|uniref:DUF481 domain-containing protein n=1 Tax=Shewanella sp. TaxID=50422 RepID=UPI003568450A